MRGKCRRFSEFERGRLGRRAISRQSACDGARVAINSVSESINFYFYVVFLGGKLLSETSSIAVEFNWSVQTYVSIFVKFVLLGP